MSSPMLARKKVVRFDVWQHPSMLERFALEPDFELRTLAREGNDLAAWVALDQAHAYVISVAKDELPRRWWADAALLARCPNLLVVSATGAGYDTVDVPACTEAGVLVVNQSGANARAVAEMTFGLMLNLVHKIGESDRRLKAATRDFSREDLMGSELNGKTLGLVGIGNVGALVAALGNAFGMKVLATDPNLSTEEVARRGAVPVTLNTLLAQSDFVSLHCPRDPGTLQMIDAKAFAAMKPGALFVSTARGGIHDEAALYAALRCGHLAGAGLDVWDQEPPPHDHPLLALNNVVATFHTAGVTREARTNMGSWSAEQLINLFRGKMAPRIVNPEVWPVFVRRFEAMTGVAMAERTAAPK